MPAKPTVSVFWFRRDLRLNDNTALNHALHSANPVLCLFIFDDAIIKKLPVDDSRVSFIYDQLEIIDKKLKNNKSSLLIRRGQVDKVWSDIIKEYDVKQVFYNRDYEPYAIKRDKDISDYLLKKNISVHDYKDQVIFEKNEILKNDDQPYTVFTPYKNRWLEVFNSKMIEPINQKLINNFYSLRIVLASREDLGLKESYQKVKAYSFDQLDEYEQLRNRPDLDTTSFLSPHLRFGTVSIREII